MEPGQFQLWLAEDAVHDVGGGASGDRHAELLVLGAGGHRRVGMGVDPGGHPDQDLLAPVGQRGEPRDLSGRVEDDPADAVVERGRQFLPRLAVAVQQDALGGEAGRAGDDELPFGAHVQRQALLGDPAGHRAAPERLGSVRDLVRGHGLAVLTAAEPYMLLVEHVGGGAETVGDLGEADAADRQRGLRGERPDVQHASKGTRCRTRVVKVTPPASRRPVTTASRSARLRQDSRTSKSQSPASRHASATAGPARKCAS